MQAALVSAYRWQHVLAGIQHERFADVLAELTTDEQGSRIATAVRSLAAAPQAHAVTRKRLGVEETV